MNKQQIKARILEIINNTNGFIKADQIYTELINTVHPGRTQEVIRKYIRELVNDQSNLIGSINQGYFKIDTIEKLEKAQKYLLNRVPDLEMRSENLRIAWNNNHPNNPQ